MGPSKVTFSFRSVILTYIEQFLCWLSWSHCIFRPLLTEFGINSGLKSCKLLRLSLSHLIFILNYPKHWDLLGARCNFKDFKITGWFIVILCQIPSITQLETAFQCQMFDGTYTLIQKTGILCNIPSTDTMRQRTNVTRS